MVAVLKKLQAQVTIAELASICIEDSDGDWSAAADLMEARVRDDRSLRDELTDPLISSAVWAAIRGASRKTRTAFHRAPNKAPSNDGIKAVAKSWYDYPIYGGVRLGDATKDEILAAVDGYRVQEESNRARREFMERIASKLKASKKVRECLTEQQIEALA